MRILVIGEKGRNGKDEGLGEGGRRGQQVRSKGNNGRNGESEVEGELENKDRSD